MPRPVTIPSLDVTLQVAPLRWGDARALYQNRERGLDMLADLFSLCLDVDPTPEDVAALPAGRDDTIERAILEASELLNEDEDADDGPADPTPEEPPEHSVMAGPAANERAQESLKEQTESDLIYQLHQNGYTYHTLGGLLVAEIDTLMEGIDRANRRREKETENPDKSSKHGGGMRGNRGGAHADQLF